VAIASDHSGNPSAQETAAGNNNSAIAATVITLFTILDVSARFAVFSKQGDFFMVKTKRIVCVALMGLVAAASTFAFDSSSWWKTFPKPLNKGTFMLNGAFNMGYIDPNWWFGDNSFLCGGSISGDYMMPFSFLSMSIGGEIGIAGSSIDEDYGYGDDLGVGVVPIMLRVGWHPNWGISNLDTYVVTKIGGAFGFWTGDDADDEHWDLKVPGGFAFGISAGGRYFFNNTFGVFAELGWERYWMQCKSKHHNNWGWNWDVDFDFDAYKVFSLGVSLAL
jgi:hypothetical protein